MKKNILYGKMQFDQGEISAEMKLKGGNVMKMMKRSGIPLVLKKEAPKVRSKETILQVDQNFDLVSNLFVTILSKYDIKSPGMIDVIVSDMRYTLSKDEISFLKALMISFACVEMPRKLRPILSVKMVSNQGEQKSLEEKYPNETQWWDRMDRKTVSVPHWARIRSEERPTKKLDPQYTTIIDD